MRTGFTSTLLGRVRRRSSALAAVTLLAFGLSSVSPALVWAQGLDQVASVAAGDVIPQADALVTLEAEPAATDAPIDRLDATALAPSKDVSGGPDRVAPPRVGEPPETTALPSGADKSGVTSQAISTPQGAGKIDGMG